MKDNGWEKHAAAVSVSGILHLVKEGESECGFQLQDIVAANRFKGKYSTVPSLSSSSSFSEFEWFTLQKQHGDGSCCK